jgi:hypothetical protein
MHYHFFRLGPVKPACLPTFHPRRDEITPKAFILVFKFFIKQGADESTYHPHIPGGLLAA